MSSVAHFYLFMGSGGVGKTTLSAAWALALANRGLRVALITIDPAKRLAQSLGLNQLAGHLTQTTISDHLWAMMLDQESTSHRLVERFAAHPHQAAKIIDNHYFKMFSRVLAGTQEMLAVYEVHEAIHSGRFDVVVLDTPPAQHALDFLEVPQRLSRALDGPALRWLIDQDDAAQKTKAGWRARLGGLGKNIALRAFTKVTSAPFIDDLLEFMGLFGGVLMQLRSRGVSLDHLLKSSSTDLWIITAPHQSQLLAAQQVSEILKERGYEVKGWLINRTPLVICDSTRDPSDVAASPQLIDPDLLKALTGHVLEELATSTAWGHLSSAEAERLCAEVTRACRHEVYRGLTALSALQTHLEEANARHLKLTLIEELSQGLTPLERIEQLAKILERRSLVNHEV